MTISTHLILAALLLSSAFIVTVAEDSLRRRLRRFRPLQLLALGSAVILVPANVLCFVGIDDRMLHAVVTVASLAAFSAQIIVGLVGIIPTQRHAPVRRVLAIGAHPDDLELACGATLARFADGGHEVHTLILSAGAVGGDKSIRPGEARAASAFLGATGCTVADFPDTRLAEHEQAMMSAIEARIAALNPDLILTHSLHDQHQDHVAVHRATMRAARQHPAILCYESPSATTEFLPQIFVDVDDYVGVKTAAVALHADQGDKPYMTAGVVEGVAAFRGRQSKLPHAEAFEAMRVRGFQGVL